MSLLTTSSYTLIDSLASHAESKGSNVAFTYLASDTINEAIDYSSLLCRVSGLAGLIRDRSSRGDRVLLLYPSGVRFVEAFLACLSAGVVAVPGYPLKGIANRRRLEAIGKDCDPTLILCESLEKQKAEEFAQTISREINVLSTDDATSLQIRSPESPQFNEVAFLQYTSGSTSSPKGVMITHENMIANASAFQKAAEHTSESVVVSWLPMFHDMGLIGGVIQSLFVGCHAVLMDPLRFLVNPGTWLQAISDYRGTSSGGPNFGYELCVKKISNDKLPSLDLSTWKTAFNGAEPVRQQTMERFAARFASCGFREQSFYPVYGLAEATLFASGGPPERELAFSELPHEKSASSVVGHGQPAEKTDIAIVEGATSTVLDNDLIGDIWLSGPGVALGYWNRPNETKDVFEGRIGAESKTWLKTGDLGFIRNGELFITGRSKDLIIIRGRNIYPHDIEEVFENSLNLEPNSCAAFSVDQDGQESIVVVIEASVGMVLNLDSDANRFHFERRIDDIKGLVLDETEARIGNVIIVRPGKFPRTSSGKVQRRLTKQLLEEGRFDIVVNSMLPAEAGDIEDMPSSQLSSQEDYIPKEIRSALKAWLSSEGQPVPLLSDSTTFTSLGIDSMAATEIALQLEQKLNVAIDVHTLSQYRTIGELCDYVSQNSVVSLGKQAKPFSKSELLKTFDDGLRRFRSFKEAGHDYFATEIERQEGSHVWVNGRKMLMMASYSYLGLINRNEVNEAAQQAISNYGTGAHGVRLLAGTFNAHRQLEQELAAFFGAEDAIVYSSGFMTNLATVSALVGKGDVVIGDELNHASIVDGCKFSDATFLTFAHNDTNELEKLLRLNAGKKMLVIVDAVYSMDGDIAPLPKISELCQVYGALLMVDEAHSLGVIGETGKGIQEHFRLSPDAIDIKMGTLSKSVASCGGFIAARREIVDFLKVNARGFIFSAALPASQVGAARKCLEIIECETHLAGRLRQVSGRFVGGLRSLGFNVPPTESAIVPIIFSSEEETLEAVGFCREQGLFVVPVFYPAVPMDRPRIRATVMASFDERDIDEALGVFAKLAVAKTLAPSPRKNN